MAAAPTRQISLRQLVEEIDPDWWKEYSQPIVYRFSNGRTFRTPFNPYGNN